ncbi:hypothetical protein BS47DRAFT_1336668 [Hydnum rufescens UP504]|uniref:Uncharacterized protein n=1 Tax=Hydnum rufescens UP504 TaxID=1448309 RepID=A0A9P6B8X4_9AGAM|nr:hypothetical protein BS47DRAFT_1336668 [Hydnum rufescens UP504]
MPRVAYKCMTSHSSLSSKFRPRTLRSDGLTRTQHAKFRLPNHFIVVTTHQICIYIIPATSIIALQAASLATRLTEETEF